MIFKDPKKVYRDKFKSNNNHIDLYKGKIAIVHQHL